MKEGLIEQLKSQEKFFLNSISVLTEEDSSFKPKDEMFTVAELVGHTAHIVEWFLQGAFGDKGFDMNFDNYKERMKVHTSLEAAIKYLKDEYGKGIELLKNIDDSQLTAPIDGPIMTGAPKMAVVGAIADHTAHHRGALTVYTRLLGKIPQDPYSSM